MKESMPDPRLGDRRWLPAVAAVALIVAVVAAGVAGGDGSDDGTASGSGAPPPVSDLESPQPVASVVETTVPAPKKTRLSQPLGYGMAGGEVERLQTRLDELGFELGPIDGYFGGLTQSAVWAFEKLILGTPSAEPTGIVTPEMWQRMQNDLRIEPRRSNPNANHTEVYLPEQVLIFFQKDEPVIISHMSSGDNEEWCEEVTISPGEYGNEDGDEPLVRGECGRSYTPPGAFRFDRQVEGKRESALGGMWNPMYFNYGIAIHGATNVPLEPASHGCIRVPMDVSELIQDVASLGDQVFVFDGVTEPEAVSEQDRLPVFNWRDPDWVPPTTVPPPTTAPPTTVPPTTTTPPPPTTTVPTTPAPTTTVATTPPSTEPQGTQAGPGSQPSSTASVPSATSPG